MRCGFLWLIILFGGTGCFVRDIRWSPVRPPRDVPGRSYILQTTGYCSCGQCCGWRRNGFFRSVISSGPKKGESKAVGFTASGVRAKSGTIAADTTLFPFGSVMFVPGYGYGRVEDRGRDIKGYRIDLYFRSHSEAMEWGRMTKTVMAWKAK